MLTQSLTSLWSSRCISKDSVDQCKYSAKHI